MKHVGLRTNAKDVASQEQLLGFRNKIMNGAQQIAQRGPSATGVTLSGTYLTDRWHTFNVSNLGSFVVTLSQENDAPAGTQFTKSLRVTVTTTQANSSNTVSGVRQNLEGYDVRPLIGVDCTLSFWVRSSMTGTYCVALRNSGSDRSYIFEYTVNSANTWEYKTMTLPGGLITAGTWDWDNVGLRAEWVLQCGSTYQASANTWNTGQLFATANQVNFYGANGGVFAITGVQLEPGSVATAFERRPYQMELALCQRYYFHVKAADSNHYFGPAICTSTTQAFVPVNFPVTMRAIPATLTQSGVAANYVLGSSAACNAVPTLSDLTSEHVGVTVWSVASGISAGQAMWGRSNSTTAFLGFSADL